MAWLTLDRQAWVFVGICVFGAAVDAIGFVWPGANQNPSWRRWRARLDVGANLAFWGVLVVLLWQSLPRVADAFAIFNRDGSVSVLAVVISTIVVAGIVIFCAMLLWSQNDRRGSPSALRQAREADERAEALVAQVRRELAVKQQARE